MLLYDDTRAPNPRRVRIFLAEKGIDVPLRQVSIIKGEHRTDEYRKLSPNSRVPVLELDDGTVIHETVAICRYFECQKPQPALFGSGALGEALVEMWQRRMELELFMPLGMAFRHTHPGMAELEKQVPVFGELQRKVSRHGLATLEKRLRESPYIAGEEYSIADITALCALDFFMRLVREEIPSDHEATLKWHEQVSARPSAQA